MTRQLITLFVIFFFAVYDGLAQTHFINDIVNEIKPINLFQTKQVVGQKIILIEKKFTLSVNKEELLKTLKIKAQQSGKDFEKIFSTVIGYISSTDSLTFEYIWTKADDFDNISWFEIDRLGARNLTKKVLKETICILIEKGDFEIFQNNKQERKYFFERVDSNYGGNGKGVFTADKTLIWICPPFIID